MKPEQVQQEVSQTAQVLSVVLCQYVAGHVAEHDPEYKYVKLLQDVQVVPSNKNEILRISNFSKVNEYSSNSVYLSLRKSCKKNCKLSILEKLKGNFHQDKQHNICSCRCSNLRCMSGIPGHCTPSNQMCTLYSIVQSI